MLSRHNSFQNLIPIIQILQQHEEYSGSLAALFSSKLIVSRFVSTLVAIGGGGACFRNRLFGEGPLGHAKLFHFNLGGPGTEECMSNAP